MKRSATGESTRRNLSLQERLEIVSALDEGERIENLADEYQVSRRTIERVRASRGNLFEEAQALSAVHGPLEKRKFTGVENTPLDKALYEWFVLTKSINEPVTGLTMKRKAKLLNSKLRGPCDFKASGGWLDRFKKRHGIHFLSVRGKKLSTARPTSDEFHQRVLKSETVKRYELHQRYNVDETGLHWKSLPRNDENFASQSREIADRVTVVFCANESGTHKVPLFVVGSSEPPRSSRNIENLPPRYAVQRDAWMNEDLFRRWYTEIFLPSVKERHTVNGQCEKVLLILDNAPCHPSAEELNRMDDACKVYFLPPSLTAAVQPMNQGVIEKTKRLYRKSLLRELLLIGKEKGVARFLKNFSIADCCVKLVTAWDRVTESDLQSAWNEISRKYKNENPSRDSDTFELVKLAREVPGYDSLTYEEVHEWANGDVGSQGWRIPDEDEIVKRAIENLDHSQTDVEDVDELVAEKSVKTQRSPEISAREALQYLTAFQNWFSNRWECEARDILSLKRMREITTDAALSEQSESS